MAEPISSFSNIKASSFYFGGKLQGDLKDSLLLSTAGLDFSLQI